MCSEGYCSRLCLSVNQHLTSGASVRLENEITYSAGNEGEKNCGVFSETARLQRSSTSCIVWLSVLSAIFPYAETRMRIIISAMWWPMRPYLPRVLLLGRRRLVMPPSKVCPECDAVVPIRLKVCKSCQHVFRAKRKTEHTAITLAPRVLHFSAFM